MKTVTYFDTEISQSGEKIYDFGAVKNDGSSFHSGSFDKFLDFLTGSDFICGHNIVQHDMRYILKAHSIDLNDKFQIIDTLYLSPLLFPLKPYHKLIKDDKLHSDDVNNPLNDSINAKTLLYDEATKFKILSKELKQIYYLLLSNKIEFKSFFKLISFKTEPRDVDKLIKSYFHQKICASIDIKNIRSRYSIELAFCLSLINVNDKYSITPPWVLKNYPEVDLILHLLRGKVCLEGCDYCNKAFDAKKGLKRFFGYDSFRQYAGEPLQEDATNIALRNKSLLAVFPTGGGKSITFQVPALMAGENTRGLTVVVSPLQSLMKDQVDNLEKVGITEAVTINGLLDPIERSKSFERVEDGSASILYLSPELLRSKTIERLLLGRKIERFVIDEAHCFSSWGQDFRVDYLYIGDFIKSLKEKKHLTEHIPVSCFTATAKQKVVEEIKQYFYKKLSINLEILKSNVPRQNLRYRVFSVKDKREKYNKLRNILEHKTCPTIIYVSRTKLASDLADKLNQNGFSARPYHGKMNIKEKTGNQDAFTSGKVQIIVATTAFGMGVDKEDIQLVIHYDISNSLENYVQESGRAGRSENISAECIILYNEQDLNKHFLLLNQTKLTINEIQQIWRAIKDLTKFRTKVSNSALEIARKAGWDDDVQNLESRVKGCIAALEDAGYLIRGQNNPRIYADSIISKNAEEAINKINNSSRIHENQKQNAIRIIKKLISTKSRKSIDDEIAESKVDYISDHLGIVKKDVIEVLTLLREEKILADRKDLTVYIKKTDTANQSLSILKSFAEIEKYLLSNINEQEEHYNIKELNEEAIQCGLKNVNLKKIKIILNFWSIKNWLNRNRSEFSRNHITVAFLIAKKELETKQQKRHELSKFIVNYLFGLSQINKSNNGGLVDEVLVQFSVHDLKKEYNAEYKLFKHAISIDDIEDSLFYLSRINAINIDGGFLVSYNSMTIDRLELNNKVQYKNDDYNLLRVFYKNKIQQIHIVGQYANMVIDDYNSSLEFVNDYFKLNYISFLNKYFPGSRRDEISRNITPSEFKELFGSLSPRQLKIIKNNESKYIVVAAGPGSGKTRLLVHKLASLLQLEDVKSEQLLMLAFSRAAVTEFKQRLLELIGNSASFIEIKTFHSYCFDLLGRIGNIESSKDIISVAVQKIMNNEVDESRITKSVLVIDEAQDMDKHEFSLVNCLMTRNEEMRVIAVGDDDQNIYSFRGSDSKHFKDLHNMHDAQKYELIENFRSKNNLVDFTNQFVVGIKHRFKSIPIASHQAVDGEVRLTSYKSKNLILPLVNDILNMELSGTTIVLTRTNYEALQITGNLNNKYKHAKLIQSNDEFNLSNLYEIRSFIKYITVNHTIPTIGENVWNEAKRLFKKQHYSSNNAKLCRTIIDRFELVNPKVKYISDFVDFIKESRIEDFMVEDNEIIYVSTIHKAKGKEFDNVFLMLDGFDATSDDNKRQLYVAMTRAKQNLYIHTNGQFFENIIVNNLQTVEDISTYQPPGKLTLQLSHKDINLGFFRYIQPDIKLLESGRKLKAKAKGLINIKNKLILKFSKHFLLEQKKSLEEDGYHISNSKINFKVYWINQVDGENEVEEIVILLPELQFKKKVVHV